MGTDIKKLLIGLCDQVTRLQEQIDESALNEVALIASLKELVPGFDQRFDILHSASRKMFLGRDDEVLNRIREKLNDLLE